jgi:NADPH2:quinone reductase
VFQVGELPAPEPGPGEVLVRLTRSGVSPGDTKKRRGWLGSAMPFPRVIPHSDGAGVVESVGEGVASARVGQRVWVFGAQSYRAFGTAAQSTVVPDQQAVDLPDSVSDEIGACLGIPGITAHRAVFADGPVAGQTVLVHGVLGAVGSLAAQLARWGGAIVIGTVRRGDDLRLVPASTAEHTVALDQPDTVEAIRAHAADGVDRIIEVSFSDNIDLDAAVAGNNAVIAARTARTSRSGRCCSTTSPSGCWAATTSRPRRSSMRPPTSPRQHATARCSSRSAPRCHWNTPRRPMTGSTPAPGTESCWPSPTDLGSANRSARAGGPVPVPLAERRIRGPPRR